MGSQEGVAKTSINKTNYSSNSVLTVVLIESAMNSPSDGGVHDGHQVGPLVGKANVGLSQLCPRLGHLSLVRTNGHHGILHGVQQHCHVLVDGGDGQRSAGAGNVLELIVFL